MGKYYKYFSLKEILHTCNEHEIVECVQNCYVDSLLLLTHLLNAFRGDLGFPLYITSSYRDKEHNKRSGGVSTSQHLLGQAIDFKCNYCDTDYLYDELKKFFDMHPRYARLTGQVIIYDNFVHIALANSVHQYLMFYDKRTNQECN